MSVPALRIQACNRAALRADGDYVLYWMIASRRLRWNFGLQRAAELAAELGKPLLIFEPLRLGYRWASDRLHRFVLDGLLDHAQALHSSAPGVHYYPYVEPRPDAGKGLLAALGSHACAIVTDDFPCFFLPHMVEAAARQSPVRVEKVDSNGLLPMRATERVFTTARSFRAYLQKSLLPHLREFPQADPLAGLELPRLPALPEAIARRWPRATAELLRQPATLASLALDHRVPPAALPGGDAAARKALRTFLGRRLPLYREHGNDPDVEARSGFSPYLHFGHLAAHEVLSEILQREESSVEAIGGTRGGHREGWWNLSPDAEAFLDELVTWRELGFNRCAHEPDYDRYEALPAWALATLEQHARDPRPFHYSLDEFEAAKTHDPVWNAAQNELRTQGRIHNYLRMLWGKKVLEWSPSPREALEILIELNNKYALDGRDPNSYSGIFWVFGRYDRAWGPERPIFGKVRYMSSEQARRKCQLRTYLARYA